MVADLEIPAWQWTSTRPFDFFTESEMIPWIGKICKSNYILRMGLKLKSRKNFLYTFLQ